MSHEEHPHPTLNDLASGLGEVQIYWCFLENEMRSQLEVYDSAEAVAKGPVIVRWRRFMTNLNASTQHPSIAPYLEALDKVARMRNLLSHCIQSVSADPDHHDDAFVLCVGPGGVSHTFTLTAVRQLSAEITYVRHLTRNVVFQTRQQSKA